MKYIFDFDDVLFYTTKKFIEHEYVILEKAGISRLQIKEYYKELKLNRIPFSMKKMLDNFSIPQRVYEEIMKENTTFINKDVIEIVKKLEKTNCYIITYGDEEFQKDKIKTSGIESLFSGIIVVKGSKKEAIEQLCAKYRDEGIIFIDDKAEYFEDIDLGKCPNLKTILYSGQDLKPLLLPEGEVSV